MKNILFVFFLFFFSCSSFKESLIYGIVEIGNEKIIEVKKDSRRLICIRITKNDNEKEVLMLIKNILSFYYETAFLSSLSSLELIYANPYILFFEVGNIYYGSLKNLALRYGIIENDWFEFKGKFLKEGKEAKKIFRIEEIDDFVFEDSLSGKEKFQLYKFSVNFLISENLFVSVQELFERQHRYFSIGELETLFSRVVIIPEVKEFTDFMMRKFGRKKIIDFAKIDYSRENWEKFFGEPINEIEEEFAKSIENYRFSDFYYTKKGEELKRLLSIYNKNSKSILFKK